MATWRISTKHKKNCEEREFWVNDNRTIVRTNGYRWAAFTIETTDDNPPQDITEDNVNGVEMYGYFGDNAENGAELESMEDGWSGSWEFPDGTDSEEQQRIIDGWDEGSYEFMENDGWLHEETEAWLFGPLEIVRVDKTVEPEVANLEEQPQPGTAPTRPTKSPPGMGVPIGPGSKNPVWPF